MNAQNGERILYRSPRFAHGEHAWREGISLAVPDPVPSGMVVLVRRGAPDSAQVSYGAIILIKQVIDPERVSYRWYVRSDGSGVFDAATVVQTGEARDQKQIAFGPFRIGWSGSTEGAGYLYYDHFAHRPAGKDTTYICVTGEKDVRASMPPIRNGSTSFRWLNDVICQMYSTPMSRRARIVQALICLSLASCSSQPLPALPDALIVLPGAQHVRYAAEHEGTIAYDLDEPYPATGVIGTIRNTLETVGWRPLMQDWLDPDTSNSLSRGWGFFIDGTKPGRGNLGVHHWLAQWQNASGQVVIYDLRYEVPNDPRTIPPARGPLHIQSALISAEAARAIRAAAAGPHP